ncbi:hypothetical protein GBAR_LOCUS14717, partial [Geodia barretti]
MSSYTVATWSLSVENTSILLLFYPLFFRLLGLCSLSESPFAIRLWRVMPIQLLDSVQNPFRDNCRFFAGLYFLYRVLIPLLDV